MTGRAPALLACLFLASASAGGQQRYVRFLQDGRVAYGQVVGETIRVLDGNFLDGARPTGATTPLAGARLLAPVDPVKVIAVGLNYKSHLGERPAAQFPGLFAKYPTSIIASGEDIVLPPDAKNVHYEGELVVVIGRKASRVAVQDARAHVFGVTIGNDVSERDWQRTDLQWFRAKASDTFGPLGPVLVTGLDYGDLLLQTRLNGEVVQSQRTKDLIFGVAEVVSYVSQYVTLMPGDVIFTGTPGTTRPMKAGDAVEVEIEGIGVLRNRVVQR